ncbi:MAG: sigma 54-interacting transcriptional regulator, partial [Cyclobacteriaceae bacterium]|nr:sigma 54-interacting transcriptional regulator [Cyclobacteriaceae bacterium]
YALFLWFIGEYTDFKKTKIQLAISILVGMVVILYFLAKSSIITLQLWELVAHITILSISIYGIVAGIKGTRKIDRLWKIIYFMLMIALLMLTIFVGLRLVFDINLIFDPEGFISPLDFFPVFFSIIIGSKMSHDVVRSYQLESEVIIKETKWSSLMENINLLVVELDMEGAVKHVNSYFNKFTGYSTAEVIGNNWFMLMLEEPEKKEMFKIFITIIDGAEVPVYQNRIKLKNGTRKSVQWSNIYLKNLDGIVTGTLSIGADVTEREAAMEEISNLKNQLEKENLLLKEEIKWQEYSNEIIGESDALKYVIKRAHQVSSTDSSVLLEGETGVGKELFANLIHHNSMRKLKPFIKVNCASLPKELIESELFGHEKGAFTGALKTRQGRFELADKGTIFLD